MNRQGTKSTLSIVTHTLRACDVLPEDALSSPHFGHSVMITSDSMLDSLRERRGISFGSLVRSHLQRPYEARPQAYANGPSRSQGRIRGRGFRSEEHTSELQSQSNLVCRLPL